MPATETQTPSALLGVYKPSGPTFVGGEGCELIAEDGRMVVTSPQDDSLKLREGEKDPAVWISDQRLRWPDTLSQGPDGAIYVTTSRIQDMSWFKPENGPRLATQLWRIEGTETRRP